MIRMLSHKLACTGCPQGRVDAAHGVLAAVINSEMMKALSGAPPYRDFIEAARSWMP